MDEFGIIEKYFAPLAEGVEGAFGLKDDAAALKSRPGQDLVVTADAVTAGVHFLEKDHPDLVARKLLRVNLSDLAAKGAEPTYYVLTAAFAPDTDEAWVARFAQGLKADQAQYGIRLIGGDTTATPGPATFSITAMGFVPEGAMVRRGGAQAGDHLYVTGTIGDGALGLQAARGKLDLADKDHLAFLAERYRLPRPRVALAAALRGNAHAALDISDGLIADAGHMAAASGTALEIEAAQVPLSPAVLAALDAGTARLEDLITGGDDYEVLLAAPPARAADMEQAAAREGIALTRIGQVGAGQGVSVLGADGKPLAFSKGGYSHFS